MSTNPAILPAESQVAIPRDGETVREGFVRINGQEMYRISGYDALQPFLMNIVSDCDLWMFLSSTGGLTAGRRSANEALFPYETDDRLHHQHGITGPLTLLRVMDDSRATLWEPFAGVADPAVIDRNIYKSVVGNHVLFEEIHHELDLAFRYSWQNCERFGFVRTATLINRSSHESRSIELLDGLLNILPAGVPVGIQQGVSCLSDAYKVCEVDRDSKLAIYSMSSLITDRPEPAEALKATVVWCCGLQDYRIALSDKQIRAFRLGRPVHADPRLRGQRGNFLVHAELQIRPGHTATWEIIADVSQTQAQVAALRRFITEEPRPHYALREAIDASTANLIRIVAANDGLQATADRAISAHHFANVLFNTMRGGGLVNSGKVNRDDFIRFVARRNNSIAELFSGHFKQLPGTLARSALIEFAHTTGNANMVRLAFEFLPLTFARRHGDPSRPWNQFNIKTRDEDGSLSQSYEGNWRDIFQNWEGLCLSHPEYLESVIAKFVNASTVDGFNPYRITQDGIDWEVPEPENPSSNIGYWGDHQVAYLVRLLELSEQYHPQQLASMLQSRLFSYANVPYRMRPYESIVRDCRDSVEFDVQLNRKIEARAAATGSDARLTIDRNGEIIHVTLLEKLLVPALAKMGNFVLGGGIWMNTRRPEWNDANNALAGHGTSVVTLCHLRRYINQLIKLIGAGEMRSYGISSNVVTWLNELHRILAEHQPVLSIDEVSEIERRRLLTALGESYSRYRDVAYADGPGDPADCDARQIVEMLQLALRYVDQSIRLNRRDDGMYHAYNLLSLSRDGRRASIERLPEMLEGQVAVLSAGLLSATESLSVVEALFGSKLYRESQESFLLYPDRATPAFLQKNIIPAGQVEQSSLLRKLSAAGDKTIVEQDIDGRWRFNAAFRSAADLSAAIDRLHVDGIDKQHIYAERPSILDLYESTFRHHLFTGRSCSMFGYEGLGCVYWHMVAKLMVAVLEVIQSSQADDANGATIARLADGYYRIRRGIGFNKSAREYGAFPTDPYSHTPGHAGARQPGMTGQVKEEIITRLGEFGVSVAGGAIRFDPRLLDVREFFTTPTAFAYVDPAGMEREISLSDKSLCFTLCQVPVVYKIDGDAPRIVVVRQENQLQVIEGNTLDAEASRQVLSRSGEIVRIEVTIAESQLRCNRHTLPELQNAPAGSPATRGPSTQTRMV